MLKSYSNDPFWKLMQAIWAGQAARDHVARIAEEIEADRRLVREQWDVRMARIQQLQEEAGRLRARHPNDGARSNDP